MFALSALIRVDEAVSGEKFPAGKDADSLLS